MGRLNLPYKQFYINLNEIWLYESDPNASSTCSEPGGQQWQHRIRGWEYFKTWTNIISIEFDIWGTRVIMKKKNMRLFIDWGQ